MFRRTNIFSVSEWQLVADSVAGPPAEALRHPEHEGGGADVPRSQEGGFHRRMAPGMDFSKIFPRLSYTTRYVLEQVLFRTDPVGPPISCLF